MFTIVSLLCLCRNGEYRDDFQNKTLISKQLFCQMSAQVKWEGRPSWSGQEAEIYSLNYLLPSYRGNVNYYKSVYHPILTLPVNFQNKSAYKLSFQLSFQTYSLLAQTEGERETFFGRVQEGGPHCNIITWLVHMSKRWNLK